MIYPINIAINIFNISILLIKPSKAIFKPNDNLKFIFNQFSIMTRIHSAYYFPNHDTKHAIKHDYQHTYDITTYNQHIHA